MHPWLSTMSHSALSMSDLKEKMSLYGDIEAAWDAASVGSPAGLVRHPLVVAARQTTACVSSLSRHPLLTVPGGGAAVGTI